MSPPSTTSSPHVYSRRWQRDPRLYPSPSNWDITLNRQGGKGSIPHTPPQNDFFFFNLLPPPLQHAALLITVLISVYMEEDISSGGVSETLPVSCDSGTLPSARSLFILPLVSLLFSGGGGRGLVDPSNPSGDNGILFLFFFFFFVPCRPAFLNCWATISSAH